MLLTRGVPILLLALLWLYCLFDAIGSDGSRVRNLPKVAWVFIILLFLDIGALAWLVAGRPRRDRSALHPGGRNGVPPEYDRPGRAVASNPDDDAAFLEQLKRRAEEQRRKAEEQERPRPDDEDQPPQA